MSDTLSSLAFWTRAAGAFAAAAWGAAGPLFQLLLVVMAADIATGILAAIVTKTLSSKVSFYGIAKKSIILVIVGVSIFANLKLSEVLGSNVPLDTLVMGAFIAHEGISLTENAAHAGIPVPRALRDALARFNPDRESAGEPSSESEPRG